MIRRVVIALIVTAFPFPLHARERTRQEQIASLFALIDRADEMVVYSEGFKREFVVYRSAKRADFESLKHAITLKRKGGPFLCACVDGPEIALLKNKKEIASVWNHEGTAIGSSVWKGDWGADDADRWLSWFDARGMTSARAFFKLVHAESRKAEADEQRWLRAMPLGLKPLWPNALKQYNPPTNFPDLKPLNAVLVKQFPDTNERIRALMAWFGSGAGPWSGFPGYEEIAAKLLTQHPTTQLIGAVENRKLSEEELEGAARILASWTPAQGPAVPAELRTVVPAGLRKILLDHCLKSSDQDKVERAKKAFAF
jgi:hypothetical protein